MPLLRSPRGTAVLLLAAVLITFGLLQIGRQTIAVVYTGIGLFLFYYTTRLVLQIRIAALNKLQVSRAHNKSIDEDKRLVVSLQLTNETFIGIRLEIFDSYPPFFRLKSGSNAALLPIRAKGFTRLQYEIEPTSIGKQAFGTLHLVMRDLAGLFFYQRDIIVEDEVEVAPRGRELVRGNLKAEAFSTFSSSLASPRKGEGIEFADIREYTYGDPYKRIEWKSTARTGELMVRELYAETPLNVMLLLDASDTMAYGQAGQTKLDYSARAIASLISYLTRRGDLFGLTIIQGKDPASVIPLGRGQLQITRILNSLGGLQPTATEGWREMSSAVRRSLSLGRVKGRTLFLILTDLETKSEIEPLKQLVAMRNEAVIISPYTPLFESQGFKGLNRVLFTIRTAYQWRTRKEIVKQAAIQGIPLIDVGPKDLFSSLIERVENHRRLGGS